MIIFNSEINEDSILEFSTILKDAEEGCTVYFTTVGGELGYTELLMEMLIAKKAKLVGFNTISSAGFLLMLNYPLEKRLLSNTYGMAHLGEFSHFLKTSGLTDIYVKDLKKEYKSVEDSREKLYRQFMSPKQLKNYKKGLDVFISHEQFKSILEISQEGTKRSDQVSNQSNRRTKGSKKAD